MAERQWSVEVMAYATIYVKWVVLGSLFVICLLRERLNRLTPMLGFSLSILICLIVFLLVDLASSWFGLKLALAEDNRPQFLNRTLAAILVILIVHRFAYFLNTIEEKNNAESESRLQALQSRIRPHFLFNSLNTIAELTATAPAQAEQAINSLSMLFRASLESEARFHSLEDELSLCRRYLDLERWRLEHRLSVEWSVTITDTRVYRVPKLIIQPLVENAVVHGVQDDGRIRLVIDIRETNKFLSLVVENSTGSESKLNGGHGIAIENIKERLFVLYDDKYSFRVRDTQQGYSVLMRFPKEGLHGGRS